VIDDGRVPVDAMRYTGLNSTVIREWMAGAPALSGSPQPGDWVMRCLGGVRAVPHELFATTYLPLHGSAAYGQRMWPYEDTAPTAPPETDLRPTTRIGGTP
jgi:hypothetical protein